MNIVCEAENFWYIFRGEWKYLAYKWHWNRSVWDPDVKWDSKSADCILQWYTWKMA